MCLTYSHLIRRFHDGKESSPVPPRCYEGEHSHLRDKEAAADGIRPRTGRLCLPHWAPGISGGMVILKIHLSLSSLYIITTD